MEIINYKRLGQTVPDSYRLGPKDTLGIFVETVTGEPGQPIPIHQPDPSTNLPPGIGYPYTVRDDGDLSLPLIMRPLHVEGLTLTEAENLIRKSYTEVQKIIGKDARISVSLIRPRTYHVVVIREDVRPDDMRNSGSSNNNRQATGSSFIGTEDRGTAKTLDLWAYQNDVLNALNQTGGMPSSSAKNEVLILRGGVDNMSEEDLFIRNMGDNKVNSVYVNGNPNIVRIPLRAQPGQTLPDLTQDDVILKDGDVVVVQSREAEVFYTGGLLQGGMYPIPRDFDLDVFGAISMAGGSVAVAAGGSRTTRNANIGSIVPPTRLLVIREVNGYQRAIRINMKNAIVDPSERILIQPNDLIMLEYTPMEVVLNVFLSTFSLRLDVQSLWN
ncbi:MAG: polysaccharide biosynthesis/export family protein [Planctomycetaceae bacterium]|jgi:protein involved in polysaccharide export with SLBB domain|nr:polysaccharide biosynthesis/export family protein [Planctomycetaceae bacterium]